MARVDDYINNESQLTIADLANRKTFAAQHNQRSVQEVLAEFRSARAQLLSKVKNIDRVIFVRTALHPRLKTAMRLVLCGRARRPSSRLHLGNDQRSVSAHQRVTWISGFVLAITSPISTVGTPAFWSASVSAAASSAATEISNPPAVCGSKSSVRISSGTDGS